MQFSLDNPEYNISTVVYWKSTTFKYQNPNGGDTFEDGSG